MKTIWYRVSVKRTTSPNVKKLKPGSNGPVQQSIQSLNERGHRVVMLARGCQGPFILVREVKAH